MPFSLPRESAGETEREREKQRERGREKQKESLTHINIHIYAFFIEHACAYVHWRFVHSRVDRPTDRRPRSLAFSPSISRSRILSLFSARAVAPVRELSQFFCFYSLLGSYVYCCRVGVGVGVGVFSFRILFILGAFSFSFRFPRFHSSLIHVHPSETRATAY